MSNQIDILSTRTSSKISEITMPAMQVVFRIGVGLMFIQHGAQKLFGWLGGMDGEGATATVFSQMGLAGILEFFGGLMIVVGLLTRPVALVLAAEMVLAYFQAHAPQGFFPVQNGGELAVLYFLAFAFLVTTGAGAWSVDRLLSAEKSETTDERLRPTASDEHRKPTHDREPVSPKRKQRVDEERTATVEQ